MHVSFKIHYRNNLIDKKDSYLISCPPSWDARNYSYGHQVYPSDNSQNMHTYLFDDVQSAILKRPFRTGYTSVYMIFFFFILDEIKTCF